MDIGHLIEAHMKLLDRKQIIITNKNKVQIMCSLLNIIAHYRHYYFSMLGCDNTIILFCGNDDQYILYKDILTDLDNILQFIKGVIYIPRIEGNKKPYIYYNTVAYIIESTNNNVKIMSKELVVNILGNDVPSYQFFPIVNKISLFCPFAETKIQSYIDIWEALTVKDARFHKKSESLELRLCLLPYMLVFKKYPVLLNGEKKMLLSSSSSLQARVAKLFLFLQTVETDKLPIQFGESFADDPALFKTMYNEIVLYNSELKKFINNFIKSWGSKLKDKKLHNIHEYIKDLNGSLNIDWLTEV
jgi:hypothetical protein